MSKRQTWRQIDRSKEPEKANMKGGKEKETETGRQIDIQTDRQSQRKQI